MKKHIETLVASALEKLQEEDNSVFFDISAIHIEQTRDSRHGDFACNIAMVLAKKTGFKPRELASQIISHLPPSELIKNVEIAGPGFINFFLNDNTYQIIVREILAQGKDFGSSNYGQGQTKMP